MAMEQQDIEEQNARCNICSRGLLPIEAFLYGNRCVFCTEPTKISIFRWIIHSTVDYLIYLQMLRIKTLPLVAFCKGEEDADPKSTRCKKIVRGTRCPECGEPLFMDIDGKNRFLGALSTFARDINDIKSIFTKLKLLRELRGIK